MSRVNTTGGGSVFLKLLVSFPPLVIGSSNCILCPSRVTHNISEVLVIGRNSIYPCSLKHTLLLMGDRTLRDRETIPPALKTIPSSSLTVGERVWSVNVPGNYTATWDDKERRQNWQKAREGVLYPGVLSVIDHGKHLVNVDFGTGPGGLTCEILFPIFHEYTKNG